MRWLLCVGLVTCAKPSLVREPARAASEESVTEVSPSEDDVTIPITSEDPVWGSRNALVTIVQFSDFECASCAELEVELDELKRRFGPTELRVVFKHLPERFHPNAQIAAEAAQGVMELAGSHAFWAFHELAFTTEDEIDAGKLEEWSALAGADVSALRAGLAAHTWVTKIARDAKLAADVGVTRAPAVFVNGEGVEDWHELAKVADEARERARLELARGTAAGRLYRVLSARSKPTPDAR